MTEGGQTVDAAQARESSKAFATKLQPLITLHPLSFKVNIIIIIFTCYQVNLALILESMLKSELLSIIPGK